MHIPWHSKVRLIQQQADIIAIYKPNDLLSHPNSSDHKVNNSILLAPYDLKREAYVLDDQQCIYLLNRLDSPTSGILLLSSNFHVAQKICEMFRNHQVKKTYTAVIKGHLTAKAPLTWTDRISIEKNAKQQLRSHCQHDGLWAQTEVSVDRSITLKGITCTQITLRPKTGRTHQLRIQCASRHYPILGDKTYGDFSLNRSLHLRQLYLHAYAIDLTLEQMHFSVQVEAPWDLSKLE